MAKKNTNVSTSNVNSTNSLANTKGEIIGQQKTVININRTKSRSLRNKENFKKYKKMIKRVVENILETQIYSDNVEGYPMLTTYWSDETMVIHADDVPSDMASDGARMGEVLQSSVMDVLTGAIMVDEPDLRIADDDGKTITKHMKKIEYTKKTKWFMSYYLGLPLGYFSHTPTDIDTEYLMIGSIEDALSEAKTVASIVKTDDGVENTYSLDRNGIAKVLTKMYGCYPASYIENIIKHCHHFIKASSIFNDIDTDYELLPRITSQYKRDKWSATNRLGREETWILYDAIVVAMIAQRPEYVKPVVLFINSCNPSQVMDNTVIAVATELMQKFAIHQVRKKSTVTPPTWNSPVVRNTIYSKDSDPVVKIASSINMSGEMECTAYIAYTAIPVTLSDIPTGYLFILEDDLIKRDKKTIPMYRKDAFKTLKNTLIGGPKDMATGIMLGSDMAAADEESDMRKIVSDLNSLSCFLIYEAELSLDPTEVEG